jgi:hypothetical protein
MAGSGAKFGRKKEEAIAALLSQRNVEEAARAAGLGTRTLMRWLQIPEFQDAYRQARRDAFGQSIARLQHASSAAASVLLKVMLDPNAPASSRIRAADSVLDHAAKAIEIEDIEVRLSELERATEASKAMQRRAS